MPHNKLIAVLQKAFSSEKLQLPKELDESSLPFPIASNITLQQYNSFVERKEISGYKLDYKKGTVYIVEMATPEHEVVIDVIRHYFNIFCPGFPTDALIQVSGQINHIAPDGSRRSPDVAVSPHPILIPNPPVQHPGPPPSDTRGNPHARVIIEVAVTQSYNDLRDKCRLWRRQLYVRSILGIKLYDVLATRDASGHRERAMKAVLWRQGVAKQKWHFGTVDKNGNQFTPGTNVCNTANDPNFIINIPVADIFYDPPVPTIGYTGPLGLPIFYNANIVIDLYRVQQAVLMKQEK
ncbi:hypothetical protein C1646_730362 [Rhizophagus diaphanus]|nr:hypothetical protein C1646_730362 [Rhizophagus diaphanus] [Rhizophagus sp. MUCL 43196]